ncbi:MAG: Gfo/Idh/MocA family oxidoreductase [Clostridia bacterium]|nr:Gfo/Idh/MocA family oxidoreductase [Clostridia bacterium]
MVIKREKKDKVKLGIVGLGRRGWGMLYYVILDMVHENGDIEIVAICDKRQKAIDKALEAFEEKNVPTPIVTYDYMDLVNNPDIDAILFFNSWTGRPEMAIKSMEAGKYTGIEVGCAFDLSECYALIDAYERTGSPLMMLENCCYGRREMMALNVAEQGKFGEIVHCVGGYHHYLPDCDLFKDVENDQVEHYRIHQYIARNLHNYPTHDFGPIAKVLKINRGNRIISLNSIASKSRALKDYAKRHIGEESHFSQIDYKQGDIVNTIITCANGETVQLCLDTTLPRAYYSRNFTVRGTRGMYAEERKILYFDDMEADHSLDGEIKSNEKEMFETYDHPLHKEYAALGEKGGHGGMDWLLIRAFVESVKAGTDTPIDAYDTVTWMAIGTISEISIAKNGAPVEFPDFTRGKWIDREPIVEGKYCLDKVCVDESVKIFNNLPVKEDTPAE